MPGRAKPRGRIQHVVWLPNGGQNADTLVTECPQIGQSTASGAKFLNDILRNLSGWQRLRAGTLFF
jgi:hypothetical protein